MINDYINVGIIGCGVIAESKHIPCLLNTKHVRIIALCDAGSTERLKYLANKFELPDVKFYHDYEEMLANPNIEAVNICTPNNSHVPISTAALKAGKHVMCEKPMAKNSEEAEALMLLAESSKTKLTICANNRFRKDTVYLKELCTHGDLGEIYFAKAYATRRRGVPSWYGEFSKEKLGGGALLDLGTHSLDLALWLMDNYEPQMVVGRAFHKLGSVGSSANTYGPWNTSNFEVEEAGVGMITMKNGATLLLEASWALNTRDERPVSVSLCGTKSGADMVNGLTIISECLGRPEDRQIILDPPRIPFYKEESPYGPQLEFNKWIDCLQNNQMPIVQPRQMLTVMKIMDAIYISSEIDAPVYF